MLESLSKSVKSTIKLLDNFITQLVTFKILSFGSALLLKLLVVTRKLLSDYPKILLKFNFSSWQKFENAMASQELILLKPKFGTLNLSQGCKVD